MDLFRRSLVSTTKLGVLSGAFHPPTRAHLALGRAALGVVDQVLLVMPKTLPHKQYEGVRLEDRLEMVLRAAEGEARFSVGASEGGLFVEIARECRASFGAGVELYFPCGSDAAERIVNWDYGSEPAIDAQLREFQLLVADRGGHYAAPAGLSGRIHHLEMAGDWAEVSATEVRRRIASGGKWEELVPEAILERVRELYCPS